MEVSWIKLTTDMFDNRKIKRLRKLPDGNSIVLIWVMLLTMAGRCNSGGMVFLTETIPYTTKMLADELDFEESTVTLAIKALEDLGMISSDPLSIVNWEKYQNVDRMNEIREYNRLAQQKCRAKKKLLQEQIEDVNDMSMTSQRRHATDKEKEEEKELEVDSKEEKIKKEETARRSAPQGIIAQIFAEFADGDQDLREALNDFSKMRKTIKKPLTEKAAKLICFELTKYPAEDWIEIVNQSTMNCWQGIFPLKSKEKQPKNARPEKESSAAAFARLLREGAFSE